MNDEELRLLRDKFFHSDLSEKERIGFNEELRKNDELRSEVAFELQLRNAFEKEYDAEIENVVQKQFSNQTHWLGSLWKPAVWLGSLMLVVLLIWQFLPSVQHPFTPREGLELLDELVRIGIENNRLDVVAGTEDNWRETLIGALEDRTNYDDLLAEFRTEIEKVKGNCAPLNFHFYGGAIALYRNRNYEQAASLFKCAQEYGAADFGELIQLPLLLQLLGEGEVDQAKVLYQSSTFNATQLPVQAKKMLALTDQ